MILYFSPLNRNQQKVAFQDIVICLWCVSGPVVLHYCHCLNIFIFSGSMLHVISNIGTCFCLFFHWERAVNMWRMYLNGKTMAIMLDHTLAHCLHRDHNWQVLKHCCLGIYFSSSISFRKSRGIFWYVSNFMLKLCRCFLPHQSLTPFPFLSYHHMVEKQCKHLSHP